MVDGPVAFARSPEKSEHDSYDSSRLDLPEGVAPMTPSSAYEMGYQSGGGHTSLTASPPLVPTDAEPPTKRRKSFTAEFKLRVVREALMRPESNRIKPICRVYTQVTPVQLRKWIRKKHLLEQAKPTARALPVVRRTDGPRATRARVQSASRADAVTATHPLASLAAAVSLHAAAALGEQLKHESGDSTGETSSFGADGYGRALLVASCLHGEPPSQRDPSQRDPCQKCNQPIDSHYLAAGAYSAMREAEVLATQELLHLAAPHAAAPCLT